MATSLVDGRMCVIKEVHVASPENTEHIAEEKEAQVRFFILRLIHIFGFPSF